MKTLLELISFTKECWACSISFHYCFSCHRCSSNFTYIWQLLIFSLMLPLLNELKTSVSSRVAYLDYHCLLAQWMEVSISVTTAGFTEQTRNSKAALRLSLHQRSSQLLDIHYLVGFLKKTLQWFPHLEQYGTPNNDWKSNLDFWLKLLTIHHVVFSLWCITWSNHILCWKTLKSLCNVFWYCKRCYF